MSQPPHGVPPQQPTVYGQQPGQPPQPGQATPPPAYLGGGAPGGFPGQAPPPAPPAYGGGYGGGLPPAPANKPRSVGVVVGLLTTFALIAFAVLVIVITANN